MDLESTQYTPETDDKNEVIYQKLREHFDGKIVRKDLSISFNGQFAESIFKITYLRWSERII